MESDDDRYRLPEFTFHEACLLTVQLTSQGLPDLNIAPEPTVRDELQKRTQREADAVVQNDVVAAQGPSALPRRYLTSTAAPLRPCPACGFSARTIRPRI